MSRAKDKAVANTAEQQTLFGRVRDERNYSAVAIFGLTDRPRGTEVSHVEEGESVVIKTTASTLPLHSDEAVWLAILQMAAEQEWPEDRRIKIVSLGDLLRRSGGDWRLGGRAYARMAEALKRISGVKVSFENTWYDARSRQRVSLDEGALIDRVHIEGLKAGDGEGWVEISSAVYESVAAGHAWWLDLDTYHRMKRPLARALYRYLVRHLDKGEPYAEGFSKLAGHLGMTDARPFRVRESLTDAVAEMADPAAGALPIAVDFKKGKGDTKAAFTFGRAVAAPSLKAPKSIEAKAKPPQPALIDTPSDEELAPYVAEVRAEWGERKVSDAVVLRTALDRLTKAKRPS